jgi:uncharacterized protein YndB with AHSA1/START domain
MPGAAGSDDSAASDELVITRVFRAPRALVFEVWTVAEHFVRWFAPRAAEVPFCQIDPRPGGVIHFCHEFDDGQKLWVKGRFDEVVAPERLVFTAGFVDAGGQPARHPAFPEWPLEAVSETTVSFEETAAGTSVTVRQRIRPHGAAALPAVVEERRLAREGWTEVFDRLAEHLYRTTTGKKGEG